MGFWVSSALPSSASYSPSCRKFSPGNSRKIGLAPGPGFPTVVISILFLGGVQLICLGILGEYIGRIYEEVKGRPLWIIARQRRYFPGIGARARATPVQGTPGT